MKPEQTRQERFISYAALLSERFDSGVLSELQSQPQWIVWRAELDEQGKKKKVLYNPHHHLVCASVKVPKRWGTFDRSLTPSKQAIIQVAELRLILAA